jgi:putative FmdB family regulatory protein
VRTFEQFTASGLSGIDGVYVKQRKNMPLYEYICRDCGEKFSEVLRVKEHDTKKVQCPKCESANLTKVIEPFFAKTTKKTGTW